MIQNGARVVVCNDGDYDTHARVQENLSRLFLRLDRGLSALFEEVEKYNLPVVVAVVTEFGRTPKVGGNTGREHWPNAFSILLNGEGIEGGRFIGETNNDGLIKGDALNANHLGETLLNTIGYARLQMRNGLITNERMPSLIDALK